MAEQEYNVTASAIKQMRHQLNKIDYRTFELVVPDGTVPIKEQWEFSTNPERADPSGVRDVQKPTADAPAYTHCSHMTYALPRQAADRTIEGLCSALTALNFDTIAFRGISGTVMAPIIAHKMNKEMILVRKDNGSNSASGRWVEGYRHARKYIVLDDLVCGGNSAIDTILAVRALTHDKAELVRIVTYDKRIEIMGPGDTSTHCSGTCTYESILRGVEAKWATGAYRNYSD